MKRILGLALCFLLCGAFPVHAVEQTALNADKQKITEQKQALQQKAQQGRTEEQALHKQIREARTAGDKAKVQTLEAQLKTLHQANMTERKTGRKDVNKARQDLRTDRKVGRTALPQ